MLSTFFGLEIARRALAAQQAATDVTGHNIANADTPGYTRQRADLAASDPYTVPSLGTPVTAGQLGTGVTVQEVERVRDNFLDGQLRTEMSGLGRYQAQNDALSEVETIFNEPSDTGLNNMLNTFFNDWQELSKNAESIPIRTSLVQDAVTLTDQFNHLYTQLETVKGNLNDLQQIDVGDINSKAQQIADLNVQIQNLITAGEQPNDLLDRRDALLDDLSKLADLTVKDSGGGAIQVSVGSTLLVDGTTANTISDVTGINSGALKGISDALTMVSNYEAKLNSLAANIISSVNGAHQAGYDLNGNQGGDFFTGTGASDIAVNADIVSDVSKVAAAGAAGAPGDGTNAQKIADLQNATIDGLSQATFNSYYQSLISGLGVDAQQSQQMVTNQQALVDQLNNRKQSISGVSLDEETTNLMQYQHGYEAAARLVTVLDDMLDTLINRMG